jgi:hypothetical protein
MEGKYTEVRTYCERSEDCALTIINPKHIRNPWRCMKEGEEMKQKGRIPE